MYDIPSRRNSANRPPTTGFQDPLAGYPRIRVRTFDVNRVVEWDIRLLGLPVGRWGYQIEPLPDGTSRVTETWQDHRLPLFQRWHVSSYIVTGQKDRTAANRSSMETTLAKIKASAEAKDRSHP